MTENKEWYQYNIDKIYEILNSQQEGLSNEEVNKRLKQHGLNKLPKGKHHNVFQIFIKQFIDPIIFILLIATFHFLLVKQLMLFLSQ